MKTEVFQLRMSKEKRTSIEAKKECKSLSELIRQALKNEINKEN